MIKIVTTIAKEPTISLDNVPRSETIFAKFNGQLWGMVVKESGRWVLKVSRELTEESYYQSRRELIEASNNLTFFVNISRGTGEGGKMKKFKGLLAQFEEAVRAKERENQVWRLQLEKEYKETKQALFDYFKEVADFGRPEDNNR